jgi:GrpB-like predicted nucleotidyltransferase (UPF0157 family)
MVSADTVVCMLRVGAVGMSAAALARLSELAAADTEAGVVVAEATVPGLHLVVGVGADVDVRVDDVAAVDELWTGRILPFAANLRDGRRAPRLRQPTLAAPDPTWPDQAARLIRRLRQAVGDRVLRIDHIGSTSVPGLPAKDLVDIQVAVTDLAVAEMVAQEARDAGFVHVSGAWFGLDRFGNEHPEHVLVDADPGRPVNANIRPVSAPVWRDALLFRDWLRANPAERDAYAVMKQALADQADTHVDTYSEAKMPWIHAALERAEAWATANEWYAAV